MRTSLRKAPVYTNVCMYSSTCVREHDEGSEINDSCVSLMQSKKYGTFNGVSEIKCHCNVQQIDFMLLCSWLGWLGVV